MQKINLSYFGTSLGYWIALFFIPLVILEMTGSAVMVSIAYALDVLPYVLFTPIAGVFGDKFRKKSLILVGEGICLLASLLLIFVPFEAQYSYLILALGFLISTFSAIHHPIFQSILPEIYQGEDLIKLNANIASITSLTGIIAPAILGILFSLLENKTIAIFIPLCYFLSLVTFYLVKDNPQEIDNRKINLIQDLKQAFHFILGHKTLLGFSWLFFFGNFGLKMVFVSLIWIYSVKYGLGKEHIAYNFIFIGIMSILGSKVVAKYVLNKFAEQQIIVGSFAMIGILLLSLTLFNSAIYLTLIWGLSSFFLMFIVVTYFTYRQKIVPQALLSRVIALTRLLSYLAIPPASLLAGYLLDKTQDDFWIYLSAFFAVLIPVAYFAVRSRQMRD